MSDKNAINLASLAKMESGIRTSYMADLYDQTIKGLGGGSRKIEIEELFPAMFPMATLFMGKAKAGKNTFTDPSSKNWYFEWGEDATPSTPLDRNVTLAASGTGSSIPTGDAGTVVTNGALLLSSAGVKIGDILIGYGSELATPSTNINKKAHFLVTGVNANGVNISLKRINTGAFAVPVSGKLYVSGSAYAETADVSNPMYTKPLTKYGSAQIFKNSFTMSRRQKNFDTRYGNDYYRQMMSTAKDHKFQIELALLEGYRPEGFGLPYVKDSAATDASGRPVTYSMGLDQAIGLATDRATTSGGTADARRIIWTKGNATIEDFETTMDNIFEYSTEGSNTRYMFGGMEILSFLRGLGRDNILKVHDATTTKLGIIVNTIETSAGILKFVVHPLMKAHFKNRFFIIDPSLIETYIAEPTAMHEQEKYVNSEIYKAEYISDLGLAVKQVTQHAAGMIL